MKRGFTYGAYGLLAIVAMALVLSRCACGSSSSCATTADCATGEVCVSKVCVKASALPDGGVPPFDPQTVGCTTDDQCGPCETCNNGFCEKTADCDGGAVEWPDAGPPKDAGPSDGGDTGPVDAGDAGDAGPVDAGDTGSVDAGDAGDTGDTGPVDVGPVDAGDAGTPDGGSCDAGSLPTLKINSISPPGRQPRGKIFTVQGVGFDTVCKSNQVFFTGDPNPAEITEITSISQIKVRVPRNATTGIITFKRGSDVDNHINFNLARRLFLTREGSPALAGVTFSVISVDNNMIPFGSGTYQVGSSNPPQPVKMPTAVVLNPKQWKLYFISADPGDEAHVVSVHDYADLGYLATFGVTGAGPGYAGLWDEANDRLLVTHQSGMLSVMSTVTDSAIANSPFTVGSAAWGLALDTKNQVYYVASKNATTGNGQIAVLHRNDLTPLAPVDLGAGVIPMDVKYDDANDIVLVADAAGGRVIALNASLGLAPLAASPVTIGATAVPMSIALGGTGADRKAYIACSNNPDHKQASPHATVASIPLPALVGGVSPVDVGIVTISDDQAGDFDQVRTAFDAKDSYVFVTSDYDNKFGVLNPDLSKVSFGPNTSPFQSPSSKGNLGIAVEDW